MCWPLRKFIIGKDGDPGAPGLPGPKGETGKLTMFPRLILFIFGWFYTGSPGPAGG